jgi:3-hydroxybutyryl-CoA dehydratase
MKYPELFGYDFAELQLGMKATTSRTITETDLRNFSGVSGDTNPMHLNEEFARHTMFGGCIVHGMLTASLLSNVIGNQLPGPGCIYLSQSLKFLAPVRVGDTVYATAIVEELIPAKRRVRLKTLCHVGETVVLEGEALVLVPEYTHRTLEI